MDIVRHCLSNGLTILIIELPHVHLLEIGLFVKSGPRFEERNTSGISHFTEHMFFRGTKDYPNPYKLHLEVEQLGTPVNALTSRDYSQYYFSVLPQNAERAIKLFAEMMQNPTFDGIDIERQIILEEYLGDINEKHEDVNIENHVRKILWANHPLSFNILGNEDNIKNFSKKDLFDHHKKYYTSNNTLLYFAGAITSEDAIDMANRYFSSMQTGYDIEVPIVKDKIQGPMFHFIDHKDSQIHLSLNFLSPSFLDNDYQTLLILQNILADGVSSRLQWHLCEELGLVYDLDASFEAYFDTGAYDIEISMSPEKIFIVLKSVLDILHDLKTNDISTPEFDRAKARYKMATEFSLDNPSALSSWLGPCFLYNYYPSIKDQIASLNRIDKNDLKTLAKKIFNMNNMAFAALGDFSTKERKKIEQLFLENFSDIQ